MKTFIFEQNAPSAKWVIQHNFGVTPNLDVMVELGGELLKILPLSVFTSADGNTSTINFTSLWSGKVAVATPSIIDLFVSPNIRAGGDAIYNVNSTVPPLINSNPSNPTRLPVGTGVAVIGPSGSSPGATGGGGSTRTYVPSNAKRMYFNESFAKDEADFKEYPEFEAPDSATPGPIYITSDSIRTGSGNTSLKSIPFYNGLGHLIFRPNLETNQEETFNLVSSLGGKRLGLNDEIANITEGIDIAFQFNANNNSYGPMVLSYSYQNELVANNPLKTLFEVYLVGDYDYIYLPNSINRNIKNKVLLNIYDDSFGFNEVLISAENTDLKNSKIVLRIEENYVSVLVNDQVVISTRSPYYLLTGTSAQASLTFTIGNKVTSALNKSYSLDYFNITPVNTPTEDQDDYFDDELNVNYPINTYGTDDYNQASDYKLGEFKLGKLTNKKLPSSYTRVFAAPKMNNLNDFDVNGTANILWIDNNHRIPAKATTETLISVKTQQSAQTDYAFTRANPNTFQIEKIEFSLSRALYGTGTNLTVNNINYLINAIDFEMQVLDHFDKLEVFANNNLIASIPRQNQTYVPDSWEFIIRNGLEGNWSITNVVMKALSYIETPVDSGGESGSRLAGSQPGVGGNLAGSLIAPADSQAFYFAEEFSGVNRLIPGFDSPGPTSSNVENVYIVGDNYSDSQRINGAGSLEIGETGYYVMFTGGLASIGGEMTPFEFINGVDISTKFSAPGNFKPMAITLSGQDLYVSLSIIGNTPLEVGGSYGVPLTALTNCAYVQVIGNNNKVNEKWISGTVNNWKNKNITLRVLSDRVAVLIDNTIILSITPNGQYNMWGTETYSSLETNYGTDNVEPVLVDYYRVTQPT